jgi:glucose-6-phosphate dehydrogenase assembly protein OpcA
MPIVRAQTHNLVIFGTDLEAGTPTQPVVNMAATHPGRVILIDSSAGDPHLAGSVSVYCHAESDKQVCGELITLRAQGSARDDAHSTIASLLLPDLPVYMWWQGMPPADDHLFEEIAALADRVYFDSNAFADPIGGLAALAALSGFNVGDLNWSRLAGWRQLMAQLYDVPDAIAALRTLRSVDVHFIANTEPYNPNRALLLVGWLASRLSWTLEEAKIGKTGGYIFYCKAGEHPLKVEVVEGHASNLEKGELTGIFVVAGSIAPYRMPRVVLGEGQTFLEMRVDESPEADERIAPLHVTPYAPRPAASILAEALLAGGDPDFSRALEKTSQFLATIQ